MQPVLKTPPMLNKENYVPWSSRLLRYAKSRPNGKLILQLLMNVPYVSRIDPGTRTILHGLSPSPFPMKTSYAGCDCSTGLIWSDRQMQMVRANGGNQFRQYAGQNVGYQNGYNAVQNVGNQVVQDAVQNQNGQIGVQNIGNGNVVAARAEGNATGNNGNQIRCYNCRGLGNLARNCTIRPKRRDVCLSTDSVVDCSKGRSRNPTPSGSQASTSGTQTDKAPVYDSDGSAEYTELLEPIPEPHQEQQNDSNVISDFSSVEQEGGTVDQHCNLDITTKTIRPQPRSTTKNDWVPSASKSSCIKNKEVEVEEHHRNLLLYKNKKHMSPECNNVELAIQNDKSEVVCAICKQCLITSNHDVYVLKYMNDMNSRTDIHSANVSNIANQKEHKPLAKKPKKVRSKERLASPKPKKPRKFLRNLQSNGFQIPLLFLASYPNLFMVHQIGLFQAYDRKSKASYQFHLKFLGTIYFGNDHVATILGYGDLQWGNILITRVYFVEGLGHNRFSVGQFCDSDLEVTFRRNACFVRNLEGVDLLKENRTTNLYTINLHEMAFASLICLMARATSTKSWLWHQRLSHLKFDTINDLAKNDLVIGLLKFKYHKEHLYPSCEQGKSKKASHPPKPVPNSKQRLHLLHMDLYL
ncbi:retrovirus-related pol polyprotein from transposon TNT 1-94 [Tanacetum coccineum]